MSNTQYVSVFEKALENAGITPSLPLIADGKFRRYHVVGDTKNRKNAYYRLTIEGEIAWGAFGCNKRQIKESWYSKDQHEFTPTDRSKIEAQKAKVKAEEEQGYIDAARKAAWIWDKGIVVSDHPYAERKGISLHKVKIYKNKIIIPMYWRDPAKAGPEIVGLQFIGADGKKMFLTGQRKKGCYTTIDATEANRELFWICEGYATGASIFEATGQPVVIAFDAGNLEAVTGYIRGKFPQAAIVIAADNDQWTTKQNGESWNPGIQFAINAAKQFGGRLIFPSFDYADPRKPTDFNDLHSFYGIEVLREQLLSIIEKNVTDVTGVQLSDSAALAVTDDIGNNEKDVTSKATKSSIPNEQERPCYKIFDDWIEEGGKKYKPGVWYFSMKAGKGSAPPMPINQWVCSPLHVEAVTFDTQDNNFGRFLRFRTTLKKWRKWAMPMDLLRGSGEELRGELLAMGVEIDPNVKNLLAQYLQSQHPKHRMLCALQVGWCEGSFVLPDVVIGKKSSDVIFQSGERAYDEYVCAGNLEGWKKGIAAYAIGNPMLMTALSGAFAGSLIELCNAESGGVHYVGDSSTGKTGLIEAACSVWGGDNYKRSWRSTANGMEGVATMFNDGLLALDEISECEPREVGAIVYSLGNGRGKQRASRTGNARGVKRWRCFILSSGEHDIETTMAEGGFRTKAGQNMRLPSVPVARRHGVWDTLHGMENGAQLTDAIKRTAKHHHGYVGRMFLKQLTQDKRDFSAFWENIKIRDIFSVQTNEGQAKRVAGRFALMAMAGELATEYGLTGWPQDEAIKAAAEAFRLWKATYSGTGNDEKRQIIEKISAFIDRHGDGRFSDTDKSNPSIPIRERAGWWRGEEDERVYLFTPVGIREALKGFDFKRALDELVKLGALPPADKNGERSKPERINGRLVRVYAISVSKLMTP